MVSYGGEVERIDYERGALVELEVDGVEYRLDAGRHGTSLCISGRVPGLTHWRVLSQARWNGCALRARAVDQLIAERLSAAFARVAEGVEL
jgi:hypothetical protein